ncbi:MAG TPA: glycosyltransferase [Actinomycetota bacterium]|nr:glycosyltransferase [Actinomycetota bacterium]
MERIANLEKRFYPLKAAESEVKGLVAELQPDLVVAYETAVAAALQDLPSPLITCLVDLDHLPQQLRLNAFSQRLGKASVRHRLQVAGRSWLLKQVMLRVLRRSDLVINFAAHHAAWLRDRGIDCRYLQTPIPDYASLAKETTENLHGHRILLLGHLRGTATLTGLQFLTEEVLPLIAPRLAASCEVRVAGAHEDSIPPKLRYSLEAFGIRLLGFVQNIQEEIDNATLILVPTPIDLGTRVRILVGFSHGRCVIAHAANTRGIPELHNRINCLIGRSGPEIAALIMEALSDSRLRWALGASARRTYLEQFAPTVVGRKFCALAQPLMSKAETLNRVGE